MTSLFFFLSIKKFFFLEQIPVDDKVSTLEIHSDVRPASQRKFKKPPPEQTNNENWHQTYYYYKEPNNSFQKDRMYSDPVNLYQSSILEEKIVEDKYVTDKVKKAGYKESYELYKANYEEEYVATPVTDYLLKEKDEKLKKTFENLYFDNFEEKLKKSHEEKEQFLRNIDEKPLFYLNYNEKPQEKTQFSYYEKPHVLKNFDEKPQVSVKNEEKPNFFLNYDMFHSFGPRDSYKTPLENQSELEKLAYNYCHFAMKNNQENTREDSLEKKVDLFEMDDIIKKMLDEQSIKNEKLPLSMEENIKELEETINTFFNNVKKEEINDKNTENNEENKKKSSENQMKITNENQKEISNESSRKLNGSEKKKKKSLETPDIIKKFQKKSTIEIDFENLIKCEIDSRNCTEKSEEEIVEMCGGIELLMEKTEKTKEKIQNTHKESIEKSIKKSIEKIIENPELSKEFTIEKSDIYVSKDLIESLVRKSLQNLNDSLFKKVESQILQENSNENLEKTLNGYSSLKEKTEENAVGNGRKSSKLGKLNERIDQILTKAKSRSGNSSSRSSENHIKSECELKRAESEILFNTGFFFKIY